VDRSFEATNAATLERLRAIVKRASDDDLRTEMAAGWTVASVLGHLAFWDQRALVILDQLEHGVTPPQADDAETDLLNDISKRFFLAMDPRTLAELTVEIAEETNRRLAALPDDRVEELGEKWVNPTRVRADHLTDIERALGMAS
jgi:mycothiol maleylpyruvate isomerase-like protein